jgi:hypothetical protein
MTLEGAAGLLPRPPYDGDQPFAFVSYSHDDPYAVGVITALLGAGHRIWYDKGLKVGDGWAAQLADLIERCASFVVMVSPTSVSRDGVLNEINFAEKRSRPKLWSTLSPPNCRARSC